METYRNRNGNSGIQSYEIGPDYIKVKFSRTAATYVYSYRKAGKTHVENMKRLAIDGMGLNSYIKKYVNDLYD